MAKVNWHKVAVVIIDKREPRLFLVRGKNAHRAVVNLKNFLKVMPLIPRDNIWDVEYKRRVRRPNFSKLTKATYGRRVLYAYVGRQKPKRGTKIPRFFLWFPPPPRSLPRGEK